MSERSDDPDVVGSDEAAPAVDAELDAETGVDSDTDAPEESEESLEPAPDAQPFDDGASEPTPGTGHPAVDEVLRSLDALEGRPVDEHVAAFEDAHEQLRRALSSAGDDTP